MKGYKWSRRRLATTGRAQVGEVKLEVGLRLQVLRLISGRVKALQDVGYTPLTALTSGTVLPFALAIFAADNVLNC